MGKGNQWWVHQRGAASVGFGSRKAARRAAASLRNAKVSRFYLPGGRSGDRAVSDTPPHSRGEWIAGLWALLRRLGR